MKIELPYDPALPLLGIYLKKVEAVTQNDIYTPIFIAALFTKTKIWQQSKCPLMVEWITKKWHMYTMEYY